jgi:pantothenate kinase-related protein Tda10
MSRAAAGPEGRSKSVVALMVYKLLTRKKDTGFLRLSIDEGGVTVFLRWTLRLGVRETDWRLSKNSED